MTDLRRLTWSHLVAGLNAGQHLAIDAIVAFVDGELSIAAHERAGAHLAECASCTAEVAAQRQARSAVRGAAKPVVPAELIASLQSIPERAELPSAPEGLAVSEDGQMVVATAAQAPKAKVVGDSPKSPEPPEPPEPADSASPLGGGEPFGSSRPLGSRPLGSGSGSLGSGPLGSGPLGSRPLGMGDSVLDAGQHGQHGQHGAGQPGLNQQDTGLPDARQQNEGRDRRGAHVARYGAGVVASGLFVGALLMTPPAGGPLADSVPRTVTPTPQASSPQPSPRPVSAAAPSSATRAPQDSRVRASQDSRVSTAVARLGNLPR